MTGITFTNNTLSGYMPPTFAIQFNNNSNEEVLRIDPNGDVYYRFEGNMVKVNCPDDISEAFLYTVLNYTGQRPEDAMIEKFMEKISNHSRSDEYMTKLEKVFRKYKLKKLQSKY